MPICASLSISRMNRTQRVHRMQRLRLSISVGPEVDVGLHALAVEHPAREVHAAFGRPEAVGEILERTLAALVAHRAVERVVDQQELEHAGAGLHHFGVARVHDHAVGAGRRARRLQLGHLLDLDHAHTARAIDAETGVIAVVGDRDAGFDGRLQNGGALWRP